MNKRRIFIATIYKSGIYCIRNKLDGKRYIGKSVNIEKRQKHHLQILLRNNHFNKYLQRSFNKYGKKEFEFFIVEYVSRKEILKREQYWIKYYNTTNPKKGYNLTEGGDGWSSEDMKKSWENPSIRAKRIKGMSKPHGPISEERRKKLKNNQNLKKPKSERTKDKMRKPKSIEARKNMKKARTREERQRAIETRRSNGKPWFSEETKRKISQTEKGKIVSINSRKKMSIAKQGIKFIYNPRIDQEKSVSKKILQYYLNRGWLQRRRRKGDGVIL